MAVEVTQGYGSRLGDSIKMVLFGIIMFIVSFPVLWWNEGRAVQTAKSLKEGQSSVVSVERLDPSNEGKLVHMTGSAMTDEFLTDPQFAVNIGALRLQRRVEMYQWKEDSETTEHTGGSKTTKYTYSQAWSDKVIDSSQFKEQGHDNPKRLTIAPLDVVANKAKLGDFSLSPAIVQRLDKWENLPGKLTGDMVAKNVPGGKAFSRGDAIFVGANPDAPAVGDCRLTFRIVSSPLTMSIVARQTGNGFTPMPMPAGDAILLTAMEAKTANQMFLSAELSNEETTWALRGVGWFLMMLGIFLVLQPFAMLVNFVPGVGGVAALGALGLAATAAGCLSLVTIGVAWVVYRPVLGVAILFGAFVGFVVTIVMMRKASASKAQTA